MARACVLINCEPRKIEDVASVLHGQKYKKGAHVKECFTVAGPHDIIVLIDGPSYEAISDAVLYEVHKISGIRNTETFFEMVTGG